jgi:hypothetical protein
MAIGNQPTWAGLNSTATQLVLAARNDLQAIINFNAYLETLGTTALEALAANDPTATTDVAELLAIFGNLASVAQVCNGEAYNGPTLPFDFVAQTIPLWDAQ